MAGCAAGSDFPGQYLASESDADDGSKSGN